MSRVCKKCGGTVKAEDSFCMHCGMPLEKEEVFKEETIKEEKKEEKTQSFCCVKGELVDCISGRVLDCMTKQLNKCPLDEEKKIEEEKIYYGGQPINKIFDNNFFNGKLQSGIDIYYTLKE